ncbi:MAG: hypothetical protein AB1393_14540 [Candidatus Edwardsbacteria bacterium]
MKYIMIKFCEAGSMIHKKIVELKENDELLEQMTDYEDETPHEYFIAVLTEEEIRALQQEIAK